MNNSQQEENTGANINTDTQTKDHIQRFDHKTKYTKPLLIKFGKVSKLTKGAGSSDFDEGGIEPLF